MHIGFDMGLVFVRAVVIRSDDACTVIDAFAHMGVAYISQMVGFSAFGQGAVFDFYKITNVHIVTQCRARSQTCKWTDSRTMTDMHALGFAIDMGERQYVRARPNVCICNHTVCTDAHAFTQTDPPLEHTIHVYLNIGGANQFTPHI